MAAPVLSPGIRRTRYPVSQVGDSLLEAGALLSMLRRLPFGRGRLTAVTNTGHSEVLKLPNLNVCLRPEAVVQQRCAMTRRWIIGPPRKQRLPATQRQGRELSQECADATR